MSEPDARHQWGQGPVQPAPGSAPRPVPGPTPPQYPVQPPQQYPVPPPPPVPGQVVTPYHDLPYQGGAHGPPQPYYAAPAVGHQAAALATLGKKEPALAGILSWLLPGLGQFYNGNVGAGIGFLVGWLVSLPVAAFLSWLILPIAIPVAIVIAAIIQAVLGAQDNNRHLAAQLMRPR